MGRDVGRTRARWENVGPEQATIAGTLELRELPLPPNPNEKYVRSVFFSGDGSRLVVDSGYTIPVLEALSGGSIARLRHDGRYHVVDINKEGTQLVMNAAPVPAVSVVDLVRVANVELDVGTSSAPLALFSPDGSRVATGDADGVARVFDAATGQPLATLRGHTCAISSLAFALDGRSLVTGAYSVSRKPDPLIRIWPLPSHSVLQVAAQRALPFGLTPAEREDNFLPAEPPHWYLTGGTEAPGCRPLWPYDSHEWR